jgi:hypothetical protein
MKQVLWLLLLCAWLSARAASPAQPARPPAGGQIAQTVRALRQHPATNDLVVVPEPVRPLLTQLKHQLRGLVVATVSQQAAAGGKMTEVRRLVWQELKRQGALSKRTHSSTRDEEEVYAYGDIDSITVESPLGHANLLAVTVTLAVPYGEDTSLYLLRRTGTRWELVLQQESNGYKDIAGAQGCFQYVVSPPDRDGRFFVVTANVNPWPQSNWQCIRYCAMRPGASPDHPVILLQRRDTIYIGDDAGEIVSVRATGFTVEFSDFQWLDPGVHNSRRVMSFLVQGDHVDRLPPFARDLGGFLNEWCEFPWQEASRWVKAAAPAPIQAMHNVLRSHRKATESLFGTEFEHEPSGRRIRPGVWELGLTFEPYRHLTNSLPAGVPAVARFTIVEQDGALFITDLACKQSLPSTR